MLKALLSPSFLLLLVAASAEAKGWETWDDCNLATYEYYDGDSFHVVKGSKDRIFRLYAVDTAETSNEHPDRIREQQGFFRATEEEILSAGKQATELTRRLLQKPFTVETQWIDAKGASRAQRFFAKITLSDGSDLAVRLVEVGLARVYGMREGLTGSYLGKLDQAQANARRLRLGLWGDKEKISMPEDAAHQEEEAAAPLDDSDLVGSQILFDRLQQESGAETE